MSIDMFYRDKSRAKHTLQCRHIALTAVEVIHWIIRDQLARSPSNLSGLRPGEAYDYVASAETQKLTFRTGIETGIERVFRPGTCAARCW